jgi:hypothetical protein
VQRPPGDPQAPPLVLDPARLLREEKVSRPEDVIRVLLNLYVPGGIPDAARARLVAYLDATESGAAALDRRVREAVHAIMTTAEYQLA